LIDINHLAEDKPATLILPIESQDQDKVHSLPLDFSDRDSEVPWDRVGKEVVEVIVGHKDKVIFIILLNEVELLLVIHLLLSRKEDHVRGEIKVD